MHDRPPSNQNRNLGRLRAASSVALLAGLLTPGASSAATVQGRIVCDCPSPPASSLVLAFDRSDWSVLGLASGGEDGSYSLAVPDDKEIAFIALASSGRQLDGFDLLEHTVEIRAKSVGRGVLDLDFSIEPAFELVLFGTADGMPVPKEAFSELFLTDPSGAARPMPIMDAENTDLATVVPALNLPLGEAATIHLQWELPHAGRIMVELDNGGAGFSSQTQGALVIEVEREIASTALRRLGEDVESSSLATGEAEAILEQAESLFDLMRFEEAAGLAVVAREDLAIERARSRIETYRKGDLEILVRDRSGQPVPGAKVEIRQTSHDFLFGFFEPLAQAGEELYARVRDAGLSSTKAGVFWTLSEPEDDAFAWDLLDHQVGIVEASNLGFSIHGSPLVWLLDFALPPWAQNLPFDRLQEEVDDRIAALVGRYRDRIASWDVVNEANGFASSGSFSRSQITALTRDAVDRVHALDPQAVAAVNADFDWYGQSINSEMWAKDDGEYFTLPIPRYFESLVAENVDFDVIGQQMYNGGCVTILGELAGADPLGVPTFDLATIAEMLDRLGAVGLPLRLSEQSVASAMAAECPDQGYWRAPWSEEQQADFLEAFYTIAFGTPAMEAITWFNLVDEESFIKFGGLFHDRDRPKAAFLRLQQLLDDWTTSRSMVTDAAGQADTRGFAGDYQVSVSIDGQVTEVTARVIEQDSRSVTVTVDGHADDDALLLRDGRFRVEVSWRDPSGSGDEGRGTAVAMTNETGFFWFFGPDNVEIVVKVLDGRGINGHFWVFYGSLSNVEYELEVIDTVGGQVRTYFNPAGHFASVGDTNAIPGP